jgi:hypothetical protein
MNKVVAIKVILPDVRGLTSSQEKKCLENMATDITNQLMLLLKQDKQQENIIYWQHKILEWQIEDYNNELKHRVLNEQRTNNESN